MFQRNSGWVVLLCGTSSSFESVPAITYVYNLSIYLANEREGRKKTKYHIAHWLSFHLERSCAHQFLLLLIVFLFFFFGMTGSDVVKINFKPRYRFTHMLNFLLSAHRNHIVIFLLGFFSHSHKQILRAWRLTVSSPWNQITDEKTQAQHTLSHAICNACALHLNICKNTWLHKQQQQQQRRQRQSMITKHQGAKYTFCMDDIGEIMLSVFHNLHDSFLLISHHTKVLRNNFVIVCVCTALVAISLTFAILKLNTFDFGTRREQIKRKSPFGISYISRVDCIVCVCLCCEMGIRINYSMYGVYSL